MRIGVDLDEVLADFVNPLLSYCDRAHRIIVPREVISNYELWRAWQVPIYKALMLIDEFQDQPEFGDIPVIPGAQEGVAQLLVSRYDLRIITSRPERLRDTTVSWVRKNFPSLQDKIYFSGQTTKVVACTKLSVDVLIDDCLQYAVECAENGVRVLLYDCPWNQAEQLPVDVERVKSWPEIVQKLHAR